jgi:hypothetical protein
LIDATVSELTLEVEDRDRIFGSGLEAAGGGGIAVDSAHRRTFAGICSALWNSALYRSVYPELGDEVPKESVVECLLLLPATRRDLSTELEFIASHFYDFLCHCTPLGVLPFSVIYEILGHGSLRIESQDNLCDFINKGIETNPEMFGLLEFVKLEYCSTDLMNDFVDLLSERFYEISASMWATLRARLVLPNITWKQFPPRVSKGKNRVGRQEMEIYEPNGIIAHLRRECGGNVHDCHVVDVTSESFEKETYGANPHSGCIW